MSKQHTSERVKNFAALAIYTTLYFVLKNLTHDETAAASAATSAAALGIGKGMIDLAKELAPDFVGDSLKETVKSLKPEVPNELQHAFTNAYKLACKDIEAEMLADTGLTPSLREWLGKPFNGNTIRHEAHTYPLFLQHT